jgi:hypothetical protein
MYYTAVGYIYLYIFVVKGKFMIRAMGIYKNLENNKLPNFVL